MIMDSISVAGRNDGRGVQERGGLVGRGALYLFVLNWFQFYKDAGKFWIRFRRVYKDLMAAASLEVFHK